MVLPDSLSKTGPQGSRENGSMRVEPGGKRAPPDLGQLLLLFRGVSQLGKALVGMEAGAWCHLLRPDSETRIMKTQGCEPLCAAARSNSLFESLVLCSRAVVPSIFGTRAWSGGRQFFHRPGAGKEWF